MEAKLTATIDEAMSEYVAAAADALEESGLRPGRVIPIAPGMFPAWDDCCDGQLYGRIVAVQPSTDPRAVPGSPGCGILFWVVSAAVAIVRCAHSVDDRGVAPTPAEVAEDGSQMTSDMGTILDSLLASDRTRSVTSWAPLEESGGCHGAEWTFTFRVEA